MAKKLSSAPSKNSSKSFAAPKELQNFRCACEEIDVFVEKVESKNSKESSASFSEKVEVEKKSLWETILEESEKRDAPYVAWLKEREEIEPKDLDSQAGYLDSEVFPILLPAMEEMLRKARHWNALEVQKCRFDGLDYLAEYLWNKNPRWPRRRLEWLEAFDIPQFKLRLRLNPRPIFPKSWLWSTENAALHIQRWVRGWLVRKREDVQELRQFWKAIAADGGNPDEDLSKVPSDFRVLDKCERHKLLAKKREKPF